MEEKKRYRFGLRKKVVFLTTISAIITYTTSAFFIYVLYPFIKDYMDQVTFTILTLVLGVVWTGILAFIAAGFIIRPLKRIEMGALKAAEGDISEDVAIPASDDEVRSLGLAFNHMLASLREMVWQIEENFHETKQKVVAISQNSAHASRQAEAISRTIHEIAAGAENSAASVQKTAESMDNVIQIAETVQAKAVASEKVSTEMVQELQLSKETIQLLIGGMERIADRNRKSMETVKRLEENAGKVEEIIRLVGDLAAQTNLLALNASIEAARAGEHGKGFAVVADEVRNLADESARAVQGISQLIKSIQTEVKNVVNEIASQVETANSEAAKGNQTNAVMEEMADSVLGMAEMVQSISGLIGQQMESIRYTASQSEEVAAIAEQTSAGSQEVASATEEQVNVIEGVEGLASDLQKQAEKLNETIKQFTL
ncbi:methyl-accepting chemotaxis protein [Bacillota bacterium Lsc_1132]